MRTVRLGKRFRVAGLAGDRAEATVLAQTATIAGYRDVISQLVRRNRNQRSA